VQSALSENIKISVIMCARDAASSITSAVLSMHPMVGSVELCFVDDASSDATFDMALKAANFIGLPFKAAKLRSNVGVPKARNIASEMASADWFMIHDADDVSLPSRLADTLNGLDNVDILGGWAIQKLPDGSSGHVMSYPPEKDADVRAMLGSSWLNPIIDPTACFSRRIFEELGGYSEEKKWQHVQDLELWHRASVAGVRFANLQKPLIMYSINPLGVTQTKKQEMILRHMELLSKYRKM
jgi:glycosyltransferase involved in cell wall biosynthesis